MMSMQDGGKRRCPEPSNEPNQPWTDAEDARLRELWHATGIDYRSTAEIGAVMGRSKNSVVGHAHRMGLPARPSPIRKAGQAEPPRRRAATMRASADPTLPPLVSAANPPRATPHRDRVPPMPVAAAPPAPAKPVQVAAPRPVAVVVASAGRVITCCWPIGEPRTPSFRFCDLEAVAGKPYCAEHTKRAYSPVRDRREDAA